MQKFTLVMAAVILFTSSLTFAANTPKQMDKAGCMSCHQGNSSESDAS